MKVPDVNVVLPGHRQDHPDHETARHGLNELWSRKELFTVPWSVWWSFLRLTTNTRVFAVPTPLDEATRFISAVRAQPGHITADAVSQEHLDHLYAVCKAGEATGNLMPDAALAALAREHGGEVISFDRGFGRSPDLRWRTPAES